MFTRSEICILCDVTDDRLKNLTRRNQLPGLNIPRPTGDDDQDEKRGWRRWHDSHALGLVLLHDLTADNGLPLDSAVESVTAILSSIWMSVALGIRKLDVSTPSKELWCALIWSIDQATDPTQLIVVTELRDGTLPEITARLIELRSQQNENDNNICISRVTMVNISRAYRTILQRAKKYDQTPEGVQAKHSLVERVLMGFGNKATS